MTTSLLRLLLVFTLSLLGGLISSPHLRAADAAPVQTVPSPAVTPATPAASANPAVNQSKDVPPQWTATRDAFLAFALEKAKTYSGKAEDAVNKAVDIATEEAPVLAREYIKWKLWENGFYAFTPIIGFGLFLLLFLKQFPKWTLAYNESLETGAPLNVIGTIIGGIGSIILFIASFASGIPHLLTFVQIVVAPRVFVVEQVLHLVKPGSF